MPAIDDPSSGLYAAILNDIITGAFPAGKRLVEQDLALNYGVSRTPIREVLLALDKDGLIERTPNRGARVAVFTADDIEQLLTVRIDLECLAIRRAVQHLTLNDFMDLERRLQALQSYEGKDWREKHIALDVDFHRKIALSAGNRYLLAFLDNTSLLIHSLRLIGSRNDRRVRQATIEHLAITRALLQRDAEKATQLMTEHIQHGQRNMLNLIFSRGDDRDPELASPRTDNGSESSHPESHKTNRKVSDAPLIRR